MKKPKKKMSAKRKPAARKTKPAARKAKPAAKKSAKKKSAKQAAKRAPKKAARRAPKKMASKRPAARKAAKRTAPKAAKKRAAKRAAKPTRLRVVAGRKPKRVAMPAKRAFETATTGATAKDLVLFELERARVAVLSSIQGIAPATAHRPIAPGKWSIREIILHMVTRDQARLQEMERALQGERVSWIELDTETQDRLNAEKLEALDAFGWDETLRMLHATRERLLDELMSVPAEPAELWSTAHPFGEMLAGLAPHDRHHAEQIKAARTAPVESESPAGV